MNTTGAGQGNRRTAIVPKRTIPRSPFVQYLEDIKDGIPNNIRPQSNEKNSGENVFAEQGNPGYNGIIQTNAEAKSEGQRDKRILLGGKLWSEAPDTGAQGRGQAEGASGAKTINPYELQKTHSPTLSKKAMSNLVDDIKVNGIREPIKYVEYNGSKYIVDGHHRALAAKQLGLKDILVEKVELPYGGYETIRDLLWAD